MSKSGTASAGPDPAAERRRMLHDANGELHIAVLELQLLLESSSPDANLRAALGTALEACRRAAALLRHDPDDSRG